MTVILNMEDYERIYRILTGEPAKTTWSKDELVAAVRTAALMREKLRLPRNG